MLFAALYRTGITAYTAAVHIAAKFNNKARLFTEGRKELMPAIRERLREERRPRIWMHCASLGEFEQGRPVLEALRTLYPGYAYVVTFFSPSGYEVRKNYSGADHVFYLPMDSKQHAADFLDAVDPKLCLFVKYEFWYYYLQTIHERGIPAVLISAIFRPGQGFFKWYGGWQRSMLQAFSHIFVQDTASQQLLRTIGAKQVSVSGDTRFDRVIAATRTLYSLPLADEFAAGHKVLVAGSTWPADEEMLAQLMGMLPDEWRLLLVPHEVDAGHLKKLGDLFDGEADKWSAGKLTGKRVLIVDKVGLLLQLYHYAHAAWIGGGFGKEGVHNVLEAAVYGVPCYYGPVYHQFREAKELIAAGGAHSIHNAAELADRLASLAAGDNYERCASAAQQYVRDNCGATGRVIDYLRAEIPGL